MAYYSNDTPLLWIRIDPELDFLRIVIFRQPDYMWQHQLDLDRDVLAQYEAVRGLRAFPSQTVTTALVQVVESERCFYRIRIEAAHSLAKVCVSRRRLFYFFFISTNFTFI